MELKLDNINIVPKEYHCLYSLEVSGQPPSIKNRQQIIYNKTTGSPLIVHSKDAQVYEKHFLSITKDLPKPKLGGLYKPLALYTIIYYASMRSDLSIELIKDLLQKAEIIENDRYIREEHLWAHIDKNNPRALIKIYAATNLKDPVITKG